MRGLFVLSVLVLTAACAPTDRSDSSARPSSVSSVPDLPVPTPRPEGPAVRTATPVPVPRPDRPRAEPFDLARLDGSTEAAVVAMIGQPDEVREQSPGKVWVYRHGSCRVEVHMYPSVDVDNMAALGAAIVPSTLAQGERERCRRSLGERTGRVR